MSILYIFSDESGTMPREDGDDPFVTATIGFLDKLPSFVPGSNDNDTLANILKSQKALPVITFVRPFPNYGNLLKNRYEKFEIMARAKCLLEGKTIQYPDKNEINICNDVWQQTISQAIIHNLLNIAFDYSLCTKIRFIFDEKTMTQNRRDLFEEIIRNVDLMLREYLTEFNKDYPESLVSSIINNIQYYRDSVSVIWSDSPHFPQNYTFGLKLADRVARKSYQTLKGKFDFFLLLEKAGFKDFTIDITQQIARPVDKKLIENWKRETGLPEPRV